MTSAPPIVIVGAGPYGLSLAAHLRASGVEFRIFGVPMASWRRHMPAGMRLKSDGFASDLYAPEPGFTLAQFCREANIAYAPVGLPVALETQTAYGLAFQERLVPGLEEKQILMIERAAGGFILHCDDGELIGARRVVIATGISHFEHLPQELAGLPAELVSHSSAHRDLSGFAGREVTVLGAGSSALDVATLLHRAGAAARLVARAPTVLFHPPPELGAPSLWRRIRYPMTGLGGGLRSLFYAEFPHLFHRLPPRLRVHLVATTLGPAGAWFMKDEVIGKIPLAFGWRLVSAEERAGRIRLRFADAGDGAHEVVSDHVIAATGYRPGLRRLPLLSDGLRAAIRTVADTPILSADFECSVPGLYFIGLIAANCFGPAMRFMIGASFAAQRVARRLAPPAAARARMRAAPTAAH